jgi:hypothetical protein
MMHATRLLFILGPKTSVQIISTFLIVRTIYFAFLRGIYQLYVHESAQFLGGTFKHILFHSCLFDGRSYMLIKDSWNEFRCSKIHILFYNWLNQYVALLPSRLISS